MKELDYNEFSNYFYLHAVPVLKKFEQKRQGVKSWCLFLDVLTAISLIALISFFIWAGSQDERATIFDIIFTTLQGGFLVYGLVQLPKSIIRKIFQKNIKKEVYGSVLEKFGLKYEYSPMEKETASKNVRYICENSDIFPVYEYIEIDDIIKGEYKGLPFTIYDIDIFYYVGSGKNRRRVTAFRGIFLATKSNKTFKSETLIKTDKNSNNPKQIGQKQRVKLEDIEFEKLFEVFSTDQIESRYLLTTAFMERLKKFRIQKQYPIEILFSRRTYMDENVFFFFDTRKDHFEVDINKNLLDKNVLYDVLLEISEMLKIVDALKLDQNIGM